MVPPPEPLQIEVAQEVPEELLPLLTRSGKQLLGREQGRLLLVAYWNRQPAGLLLAGLDAAIPIAQLETLAVAERHRRRGIATALLHTAEGEFRSQQISAAYLFFDSPHPDDPAPERLRQKGHWEPSEVFLERYHFDMYRFHPPWMDIDYLLPAHSEELPWSELTARDRSLIDSQLAGGVFPPDVYPFGGDEELIETSNSLFLRWEGKPAGWMVTQHVAPNTLKYAHFFLRPELRGTGASLRLLGDSIRRQQASPVQYCLFEVNPQNVPTSWMRFVQQQLAPYAQRRSELRRTWKDFRYSASSGIERAKGPSTRGL